MHNKLRSIFKDEFFIIEKCHFLYFEKNCLLLCSSQLQVFISFYLFIYFLLLFLSLTTYVHYVTLSILTYTMVLSSIEANWRQPCFNGIYLTKTKWNNYQKYFLFQLNRLNRNNANVHRIYSWNSIVSPSEIDWYICGS